MLQFNLSENPRGGVRGVIPEKQNYLKAHNVEIFNKTPIFIM